MLSLRKNDRNNIILDLDQTLISCESASKFNKNNKYYYYREDKVIVERPHLQEFLDFLFDNFNVSVWSAASFEYCDMIIETIILKKKNRKLDYLFHRDHCLVSKELTGIDKNLSLIWNVWKLKGYLPCNTILIDDRLDLFPHQKDNYILIRDFHSDETNDKELLKVIKTLSFAV